MRSPRFLFLVAAGLVGAARRGPAAAQAPIKIGEINSYSGIGAPFTGPYKAGVEMAVEEINAKGGVLGRKLEVLFRDDKGQPAEAVKHAQELVESEKVALIAGTFLSNVGLAVSDWAKQNKVMFVAAGAAHRGARRGPRGTTTRCACAPTPTSRGGCSRRRRQDEVRQVGDHRAQLRVRQARVGDVPRPAEGDEARDAGGGRALAHPRRRSSRGPLVTAIMTQNPDALYVSLFGSDWLAFVREAQKRGLFQKMFVVGILLGEPEYIDPLKLEAPEGMLVTGYPWYDIKSPAHQDWVARYTKRGDKPPVLGSLIGYITYHGHRRRHPQGGRARRRPSSWPPSRGSRSRRPSGPSPSAPPTASPRWAPGWARPRSTPSAASGVMVNHEYVAGEKVLPSDDEVKKMRPGNSAEPSPFIPPSPALSPSGGEGAHSPSPLGRGRVRGMFFLPSAGKKAG